MKFILYTLILLSLANAYPKEDLVNNTILNLPYTKQLYSGYLQADTQSKQNLFYLFAPSQNQAKKDPILIWFNGGPGCSSLLGFIQENGPMIIDDKMIKFQVNLYSWNKNASVLYLESPSGVGFSYGDSNWANDDSSAEQNFQAVISFYKKYPEFKPNDLYITGESYAGIYVPLLAHKIMQYNQQLQVKSKKDSINLKGIAVGNACTENNQCSPYNLCDSISVMIFLKNNGIVSESLYQEFQEKCKERYSEECIQICDKVEYLMDKINFYDIRQTCYPQDQDSQLNYAKWRSKRYHKGIKAFMRHFITPQHENEEDDDAYIPCLKQKTSKQFFRQKDVRLALHIPDNVQEWDGCTERIQYDIQPEASYYVYPDLIKAGYKILVYSGTTDCAVPTVGTVQWVDKLVKQMNLKETISWTSWTVGNEFQGYKTQYEQLTLVTFHGIGHMVPQYNRAGALKMINTLIFENNFSSL